MESLPPQTDIGSEIGVRGVSALPPSPPSGLQARQNQYEQMSVPKP